MKLLLFLGTALTLVHSGHLIPDFCRLPKDEGHGTLSTVAVYYDQATDLCHPFIYRGQGGNLNRFSNERDCIRNCSVNADKIYPIDLTKACHFPKAEGNCTRTLLRYYYDSVTDRCRKFFYSGCFGNGNRFTDSDSCKATCDGIHDFCRLPKDEGHGALFTVAVHYDQATDLCHPFLYRGQGGNLNRFSNERECIRNCSVNADKIYPIDLTKACHFPKAEGNCSMTLLRYYYDSVTDRCRKFHYSGCFGNGNRFTDSNICNATCDGIHDFCRLPKDEGHGTLSTVAVHYDQATDLCHPFIYRGQGGNLNRFSNERDCIRNCSVNADKIYPIDLTKACHFPKAEGNCTRTLLRYYYDSVTDRCRKFFYSGCFGNGNRFTDSDSCKATCDGIHDFCRLPKDEGHGTFSTVAVHYDQATDLCHPFLYRGQGGNLNRFSNERDCIRNCSVNADKIYPMDLTKACHFPKAEGNCSGTLLRYYYDSVTDRCRKFFYSGCFGNGNRFTDSNICKATCDGIHDFCRLPKDEGHGTLSTVAVHYDQATDLCHPFLYRGQGGNLNRFSNERDCIRNCSVNADKIYPIDLTKACHFPKAEGNCTRTLLRYYYDSVTDRCRKFFYSGCFGNGNRFTDSNICKATCDGIHDFCRLPKDEGHGTLFTVAVHYDQATDLCHPFIYRGQGGNLNRFSNERDCIRNCSVNADKIYPIDLTKACHFPKAEGNCSGTLWRYYYDSVTDRCRKFFYSGCFGNGNRFTDSDSCKATCDGIHDFCRLPKDEGHGALFTVAVHYDQATDLCHPFLYRGQGGNLNRFSNERECIRNCSVNADKIYPIDLTKACHFPKAEGNCSMTLLRYYYDSVTDRCRKFHYSGCFGNGNRFTDSDSCKATCDGIHDFCRLPKDEGHGTLSTVAVHYDQATDLCHPFVYRGQGGNQNRFSNERDCIRNCSVNADKIYPIDLTKACHFPKAEGNCTRTLLRYYYDSVTDRCRKFFYSGCSGNGNRFTDSDSCKATCDGIHDFCRLPKDEGHGTFSTVAVHYDQATDLCHPFVYRGQGGNLNRFSNERECIRNCSVNADKIYPMDLTKACHFPKAEGNCSGTLWRYYYDSVTDRCRKFFYSGCFGNGNRFTDSNICNATCDGIHDFCRLPKDEGHGTLSTVAVHYDQATDLCHPFLYRGQGGNLNRFSNERDCIRNCSVNADKIYPIDLTKACHFPKAEGNCTRTLLRYYYDSVTDRCRKFFYSGCFGNGNRFTDSNICKATCDGIHDFCRLPKDEGHGTFSTVAVHYDQATDLCHPFLYRGQGGNLNRFSNERDCIRNCSVNADKIYPMDLTKACHFPKAEGNCSMTLLRYYYDSVTDRCRKFFYSGCFGNGNRFTDSNICKATCDGIHDFCRLPKDEGHGALSTVAVHYDQATDLCHPFIYRGQGGNLNRFSNERDCIRNCSVNADKIYPIDLTKACHFPKAEGNCTRTLLRYYYDSVTDRCRKFFYSGCFGNGNRFTDSDSCKATCDGIHDFCRLPKDEGHGTLFTVAVHYDQATDLCHPFIYRGQGGNLNRFSNERDCIRNCSVNADKIYPIDLTKACHFPKAEGNCSGTLWRYYYDSVTDRCRKFFYSGCFGNGNRFTDSDSCKATCDGIHDFCRLPKDEGHGTLSTVAVHYDQATDLCHPFVYRGQGGNLNRFSNERDCIRNCSVNADKIYPIDLTKACHFPKAVGNCTRTLLRYYYDSVTDRCRKFFYSGCSGNGNRFTDSDRCKATCDGIHGSQKENRRISK